MVLAAKEEIKNLWMSSIGCGLKHFVCVALNMFSKRKLQTAETQLGINLTN